MNSELIEVKIIPSTPAEESVPINLDNDPLINSQSEGFDLDERGLDEDVVFTKFLLKAETEEIPKEILVATAAAGLGGVTITIIIILIALVLGLGIGLGVGAGVGVGLGIGLNSCPTADIQSTTLSQPLCYDSSVAFQDWTLLGAGFFQSFDKNGVLLANPSIFAESVTNPTIGINVTTVESGNFCAGRQCQRMNTTGFPANSFSFSSNGGSKLKFGVVNKDGCLIQTTATLDVYALQVGVTSHAPFCISSTNADPAFNPIVSITGQGFYWDGASGRSFARIGGVAYPITNMTNCEDSAGTTRVCRNMYIRLSGNTFPSFSTQTIVYSYESAPQTCSAAGSIWAPTYATVTSQNVAPQCFGVAAAETTTFQISGSEFFAASIPFLQRNGVRFPATFSQVASGGSINVRWSSRLTPGVYTFGIDNNGCYRNHPAVTLEYLAPWQIYHVEPKAISKYVQNVVEIWTTGNTFPLTNVFLAQNGVKVATYDAIATGNNQFKITIAPGSLVAGSYNILLENTNGCQSMVDALASATLIVSDTEISISTVDPVAITQNIPNTFDVNGVGFAANPYVYLVPSGTNDTGILVASERTVSTKIKVYLPPNFLALGAYDIIVVNRDGSSTRAANATTIYSVPTPWIQSIKPGSFLRTTTVGYLTGDYFFNPTVFFRCIGVTYPNFTVTAWNTKRIDVTFGGGTLLNIPSGSYCTVHVTNDNVIASMPYHGTTVHDTVGTRSNIGNINLAREHFHALTFQTRKGSKYMLVQGGRDSNDATIATSNNNFAEISEWTGSFVGFSSFVEGRTPNTLLGQHSGVVGEFIYTNRGTGTNTVYRAHILDPLAAPTIFSHTLSFDNSTGRLLSGNYYYAVSAVYAPGDSINPGGETLLGNAYRIFIPYPSVSGLNSGYTITINWDSVPGAVSYNVWRTAHDQGSSSLQFLINVVPTTFTDLNQNTLVTRTKPFLIGKWATLTDTVIERSLTGGAFVPALNTPNLYHWYMVGGLDTDINNEVSSIEFMNITVTPKSGIKDRESHSTGAWTLSARTFAEPLQQGKVIAISQYESSSVPPGQQWLYMGNGIDGTSRARDIYATSVLEDGQLAGTPTSSNIMDLHSSNINAYCLFAWNNQLQRWGGELGSSSSSRTSGYGTFTATVPQTNPTGDPLSHGDLLNQRRRMGCVQDGGFAFLVSGATGGGNVVTSIEGFQL